MKHKIDLNTWERKDNFNFFMGFKNPCISVCSEVECGNALKRAKERGESFFLHYLYAILRSANEIKELRYRIDHNNDVMLFDTIDAVAPIHVKETGKFYTVRIAWHEDFDVFHREARRVITEIPVDGDPYELEKSTKGDDHFNVILVSAIPDLYFTSSPALSSTKMVLTTHS